VKVVLASAARVAIVSARAVRFTSLGDSSDTKYVVWEIHGPGLDAEIRRTRYVTPRLDAGNYTVTLTIFDYYDYSANITKSIVILPEIVEDEPESESGFTILSLSDIQAPSSSLINKNIAVNLTLDYLISGTREIRFRIVDVESGSVLSSVEALLETNGSRVHQLSLLTSVIPRPMLLQIDVDYYEDGVWVKSDSSPAFTVDLEAPEQGNEIPGFPLVGILSGISVLILLKRRTWWINPSSW
jgi:hypothetical protein